MASLSHALGDTFRLRVTRHRSDQPISVVAAEARAMTIWFNTMDRVIGRLNRARIRAHWEQEVLSFATAHVIPGHLEEVRSERLEQIDKVEREVKARLTKEISFWDRRAQDLKEKERAGKDTRLPAGVAQERADQLADRLQGRTAELQKERHIVPGSPQIKGGALIIPRGLLEKLQGRAAVSADDGVDAEARKRVEMIAMKVVMGAERALGRDPKDVSMTKGLGHDLESRCPDGSLVFIEVKGRAVGADQVTLTVNEIRRANNVPEQFRLAVVIVENNSGSDPVYVRDFDFGQPGFAQTCASFNLGTLLQHGGPPE